LKEQLWQNFLHIAKIGRPEDLPMKTFKPKHNLPILASYKEAPSSDFWDLFPKNYNFPGKSKINFHELQKLVKLCKIDNADQILHDVKYGASIGCMGHARLPSFSKNAESSFGFGPQVTDAICDWIHKGFALGPFKRDQIPKNAKISSIMCRPKPNGSARVILNLSAPKGQSVNDGIDNKYFPATMSSTEKWLCVLNKAGQGCNIVKIDWSDAYKHVAVTPQDVCLQYFSWLGMFFAELCLIFGASSSAGIFDRTAKLIITIVIFLSGFPKHMICQHLDDTVAAAPAADNSIYEFDKMFQQVAERVGISLAPRDDPDKSFAPCTAGTVLGVFYDTEKWIWKIPDQKLIRLLQLIYDIMDKHVIEAHLIESLAGKIINIKCLIPESRFHISELMNAVKKVRAGELTIVNSIDLKNQLDYWRIILPACNGHMPIPNLDNIFPQWALNFYTDAAGGSQFSNWRGLGMVYDDGWCYLPWPKKIYLGKRDFNGKILGKKLSFLEILGPLLVLCSAPKACAGKNVIVWIDNSGAVEIWKKGYSSNCNLCTTVVKAIAFIASHLNCRLDVQKILRCSSNESLMADNISKGDFKSFLKIWNKPLPDPNHIPKSLISWLCDPIPLPNLGSIVCDDLLY
jgi:hypothetical protein